MDLTLGNKSSWDTLRGREGRIFSNSRKLTPLSLIVGSCTSKWCYVYEFWTHVCSSPLADVELIAFAVSSSLQEKPSATLNYLRGLGNVIYFYKSQNGTRTSPARSCRELHLEHPDYPSGRWIITLYAKSEPDGNQFPRSIILFWTTTMTTTTVTATRVPLNAP